MKDIDKKIQDEDLNLRIQKKFLSLHKSEATEEDIKEIKDKLEASRKQIIEMIRSKQENAEGGKKL